MDDENHLLPSTPPPPSSSLIPGHNHHKFVRSPLLDSNSPQDFLSLAGSGNNIGSSFLKSSNPKKDHEINIPSSVPLAQHLSFLSDKSSDSSLNSRPFVGSKPESKAIDSSAPILNNHNNHNSVPPLPLVLPTFSTFPPPDNSLNVNETSRHLFFPSAIPAQSELSFSLMGTLTEDANSTSQPFPISCDSSSSLPVSTPDGGNGNGNLNQNSTFTHGGGAAQKRSGNRDNTAKVDSRLEISDSDPQHVAIPLQTLSSSFSLIAASSNKSSDVIVNNKMDEKEREKEEKSIQKTSKSEVRSKEEVLFDSDQSHVLPMPPPRQSSGLVSVAPADSVLIRKDRDNDFLVLLRRNVTLDNLLICLKSEKDVKCHWRPLQSGDQFIYRGESAEINKEHWISCCKELFPSLEDWLLSVDKRLQKQPSAISSTTSTTSFEIYSTLLLAANGILLKSTLVDSWNLVRVLLLEDMNDDEEVMSEERQMKLPTLGHFRELFVDWVVTQNKEEGCDIEAPHVGSTTSFDKVSPQRRIVSIPSEKRRRLIPSTLFVTSSPSVSSASSSSHRTKRGSPRVVVTTSGLPLSKVKSVSQSVQKLGGSVETVWTEEVTHVIVDPLEQITSHDRNKPHRTSNSSSSRSRTTALSTTKLTRRTAKYLCAMLSGKWIVTTEWIEKSFKQGRFIDEDPYMIDGDEVATGGPEYGRLHPKELFRGCGFYFSLDILFVSDISKIRDFSEVNWDSLELWQIVRSGGGIILGVLDSSLKQRMEFLSPPFEVDAKKKGRTELVQFLIIAKSDLSVMDALRLYARGAVGVMVDVSYLYDSASHGKLLEKEDHKIFRRKK